MAPLMLPPNLTPDYAMVLKEHLLDALAASDVIIIDGGRVASLSTPCLQVLLAAGIAADKAGTRLVLRTPSPELVASLGDFGIVGNAPWQVQE